VSRGLRGRWGKMDRSDKSMTRRESLAMMAGAAAATLTPGLCWSENGKVALRLAISDQTLAGANVSDARAAYRVWLGEVRGALGVVTAEPVPDIFIPSEELIRNVRKGTLDCYGITGLEFV